MTSAIQAWKDRTDSHNAQTARARGDRPEHADLWSTLASGFRADPHRADDPVVNLLLGFAGPDKTVLDVGGGAGRYALPLALRCRHVTLVEPSPSMTDALNAACRDAGIENVSAIPTQWEDAEVEPADILLCANVVYGIADIEPFVRKLNATAREVVAIVASMDAPLSMMSPLWEAVHGEERINLPALPELMAVLWDMGIYPNLQMVPPVSGRAVPSLEAALQIARVFLYVEPNSEADERLRQAVQREAVEGPNGVTLRRAQGRPQGVAWWRPGEFGEMRR
jgi:SAM-dependent methyltransferase